MADSARKPRLPTQASATTPAFCGSGGDVSVTAEAVCVLFEADEAEQRSVVIDHREPAKAGVDHRAPGRCATAAHRGQRGF